MNRSRTPADSAQDTLEFLSCERLQGGGADVTLGCELCHAVQNALLIFCADNQNSIVGAKSPILTIDGDVALLGHFIEVVCPRDRVLDGFGALYRELDQHDVSFHWI